MGERKTFEPKRGLTTMREVELENSADRAAGTATFMGTVRRNIGSPDSRAAAAISRDLASTIVVAGRFEDDRLAVLLSDDRAIEFVADGRRVASRVMTAGEFHAEYESCSSSTELIRLTLETNDGEVLESQMDRIGILEWLVGKAFRRIVVDEFGTYLHLNGERRYLALHAHLAKKPPRPFLEWLLDTD